MSSKDARQLLAKISRLEGWSVEQRKGTQHWKVTSPTGQLTWIHTTPGSRWLSNKIAELRRLGAAI